MYQPGTPSSLSRDSSPNGSVRSVGSNSIGTGDEAAALRPPPQAHMRRALFGRWLKRREYDEEKVDLHRGSDASSGSSASSTRGLVSSVKSKLPERRWKLFAIIAGVFLVILTIILSTTLTLLRRSPPAPSFGSKGKSLSGDASAATVDLPYGKYQGIPLSNNVTQWLGMRFSGPPTGKDRFKAPTPPVPFQGVKLANKKVPGCHGVGPADPKNKNNIEDCVSIDVYSPSNASPDSRLPVYVFIQGGGNSGAGSHVNGSEILKASDMGMVFASITYRVGAYGFLASSEVQSGASLNNGYKDQRAALQWVKDYIPRFGGNPDSITIGGQSAGGGAILAQLAAYGKTDNGGLFHAAIAQSPSMPAIRTVDQQQFQYDDLVRRLNCTGSKDTLDCLRDVPHQEFLNQVVIIPFPGEKKNPVYGWNPVVDDDFVPVVPAQALSSGNFAHVPMIVGDVNDEGSIFAPRDAHSEDDVWDFLKGTFPALTDQSRTKLDELYNLTDQPADDYFARAASVYGEMRYVCSSHQVAAAMAAHATDVPVWRYRFDALDGKSGKYGVSHGAEMDAVFGLRSGAGKEFASYVPGGRNAGVVSLMQGYWTSFIMNHDPNVQRNGSAPLWETTAPDTQRQMRVKPPSSGMEPTDPGQIERCDYITSIAASIEQ